MPTVVISPFNVADFPKGGGHSWVYLQYVLGLRQLGHEVYWLEAVRKTEQRSFRRELEARGLGGKLILYRADRASPSGKLPTDYLVMSRAEAEAVYEKADLLLNFHYTINPALLARFRRTALVNIDPGLLQFWISRGQLDVPRHDFYFSISEGIGRLAHMTPDCGLRWIQSRPAVCLEHWPYVFDPRCEAFSTVSLWDSSDWVVDAQETYENTKRMAFLEFADLPRLTRQPLELALFLRTSRDAEEQADLQKRGWRIRHSRDVAATPGMYQRYIQRSRGEFSCAKRSCVRFQNAWISDRSLCYLASGKPIVVQHTGPSAYLPEGQGLFRFSTMEEAVAAFDAINVDYQRHCQAARHIAESFFDAKQVVTHLLNHALN